MTKQSTLDVSCGAITYSSHYMFCTPSLSSAVAASAVTGFVNHGLSAGFGGLVSGLDLGWILDALCFGTLFCWFSLFFVILLVDHWLVSGPRRLRLERVPLSERAGNCGAEVRRRCLLGKTFPPS
eukprot:6175640-Pleurochrysis_carterae.AAC.1